MANVAKVAFEAMIGIIFITMAVTAVGLAVSGGQFTGMSAIFVTFVSPILIAIYLYLLAKNAGII